MVTERQKSAVHFCEEWLHISFDGDINDRIQVNEFLDEHLDDAENLYEEMSCEYQECLMEF